MPLADYDTSIKKIAALKAAMIDPSLIQIALTSFATTEIIYAISGYYDFDALDSNITHDGNQGISSPIESGNNITISAAYAFLYIKDSDIAYSDPITTYQDRLATMLTTPRTYDTAFNNVGTYGSIVLDIDHDHLCQLDDKWLAYNQGAPFLLPLPTGHTFGARYASDVYSYIDLPADW